MKTVQYTIRSVPKQLDAFFRRKARQTGKSLNQTVLDCMQQSTKLDMKQAQDDDDFSWFIGSGMDDETARALEKIEHDSKKKSSYGL